MSMLNAMNIFNLVNDAIFVHDPATGAILDVNDRTCELYDCTRDEALAADMNYFSAGVPPYTSEEAVDWVKKAMSGGPQTFEWHARKHSGNLFWVEVTLQRVEWGDREHLLAVVRDLTERKRTETIARATALRLEILSQLNQMVDSSLEVIMRFSLEGALRLTDSRIGYVATVNSEETELTMLAWSQAAMEGCQIIDKPILYPLEKTGLWGEAIRQRKPMITNAYTDSNPWKRGLPEGHVPIQRHLNVPIFDREKIVLVIGVGNKESDYDENDIYQLTLLMNWAWQIVQRRQVERERQELIATLERRIAERTEDLLAAQQMLATVIETIPVRVFWKDRELRVLGGNRLFARDAGMETPEAMVGKSDYELSWADQAELYRADDRAVMETGVPRLNYEEPQTASDGSQLWLRTSKVPLRDKNGQVIGVLGIYDNITAQKQAELEREQLQQEVVEAQQRIIKELATPIIPIMDGIIVMPLIGGIDSMRARDLTRVLLKGIQDYHARVVIIDVTGVPLVDTGVASHLNRTIQAARLKGAHTIVVGISDAVAETIVDLGIDWSGIETLRNLQSGLIVALESQGVKLSHS